MNRRKQTGVDGTKKRNYPSVRRAAVEAVLHRRQVVPAR